MVSRACGAAAGCPLRDQVPILLSPCCPCLLLPAEPLCGSPRPPPCVCVLGGSLGDVGVTVTPAQAAALPLTLHPGRRFRSNGEAPGEETGRAQRLRPPASRGRGCRSPLLSLLFGALRLPLSPYSRPECQTGGGDEPTTPPSRFPWKPLGGDAHYHPPQWNSENSGGARGRLPCCI